MSHGGGGTSIAEVVVGFIVIFLVLFGLWYYTGGPQRTDTTHPFQKAPAPLDTGESYGPATPPVISTPN